MNCKLCNSEITSTITGEFCTSCFFKERENESIKSSEENNRESGQGDKGVSESSESTESDDRPAKGKDCTSDHNKIKAELIRKGMVGCCPECNETLVIDEDLIHSPSKESQGNDGNVKYCQSCIERGFGKVPATREWQPNYFICDDCFEPLINNILNPTDEESRILKSNPIIDKEKPILNQFYDLLGYPEHLRYQSSDKVLNSRNEIFNYHAPALINKEAGEVAAEIEELKIIAFQIKYLNEFKQDYINRIKASEREKNQLISIEKGKKEFSKIGPSKAKTSQDQKMADTLFKATESNPEKRLKMYLELQKGAREKEFKDRTGT